MKCIIALLCASSCFATETPLFKNNSLEGWHIVGPHITYTIKDGVLFLQARNRIVIFT
jgi:hypothetical protein